MKNVNEWNTFMKTGRVEDYLRYTSVSSDTFSNRASIESEEDKKDVGQTHAESDYRSGDCYQIRTSERI
ncbi:MAG: hypothetical protein E7288_02695 [Lachnospiraceae bacterium]|nr:hypothetical protein [Lachnospiraceae bacterium]